jgi:hypothetical protein
MRLQISKDQKVGGSSPSERVTYPQVRVTIYERSTPLVAVLGLLALSRGVPGAYLEENVRRGISIWARVGPDVEQRAVRSLRDDLASGRWAERNRDLVDLDAAELDSRLLIA